MNKIESRLQDLAGTLPEGVAGTRAITELTGNELRMVSGGIGVTRSVSGRGRGGSVRVSAGGSSARAASGTVKVR